MKPTRIDQKNDLVIVGIALRTSAASAAADIPGFWQRFMGEGIAAKARDGNVYAVYCDYESDFRGPYTMVLGVLAEASAPVPPGMRRVRVPAGAYASFAAQGNPAEVIWKTWMYINGEWNGERRYIADYERYPLKDMSPSSVKADIIVGVT